MPWAIGMYLLGISYGSVLGDLESFLENITIMEELLTSIEGFSLTEQFLTMLMSIMAILSTVPALMAMLKLIGEERKNRTEHILGRAVSRLKLIGSYFFLAIMTSFVMISLTAIGLWSAGIAVMEDAISFNTIYQAATVYLPAMWLMIGIAVLLIGMAPRLTSVVWLYLVFSFIVVYLGELLQFPDWLSRLSPYGHIPQVPVEDVNIFGLIILTVIACVLTIVGYMGYQKRDISG